MKRLVRGEKGYILIVALLVLVLVGLISGPVLSYMVSGLRAGHVFETGAAELYAADAGVEDAVCQLQNGIGKGLCVGQSTNYTIPNVNNKPVAVNITLTNNTTGILSYNITSIATTSGNSHTKIESYVKYTPGSELAIFSGVLASKSDIHFVSNGSNVTGDIYACPGSIKGNFNHPSGQDYDATCPTFPESGEDLAFAQMLKNMAMAGQNVTGNMNIDSKITLNSTYISGNLIITSDFTLAGIVYVGGKIDASQAITITGSGSLIALVAEGTITFDKCQTSGNPGNFIIMTLSTGGILFKKEVSLSALVYAPNGEISFSKEATVYGGIVGQSITVTKDASLTYVSKAGGVDLPGGGPGAYTIETYSVSRNQ